MKYKLLLILILLITSTHQAESRELYKKTIDSAFLITSPIIYKKHPDKLIHYLFTNLVIKTAMRYKWCKKHPYITKIGVFTFISVGKELIWDKAMRRGNASWGDVYYGNLPGLVVNL